LAKKLNISYSSLIDLNPELQRGITPPGKHLLRIPAAVIIQKNKADDKADSEDSDSK
jgi:hypothetical protein